MASVNEMSISLRLLEENVTVFSYQLDDAFYQGIDQQEIKGGKVSATVTIKKVVDAYDVTLQQQGEIQIVCQRCLENMALPIDIVDHLVVKYGTDTTEETDELVVLRDNETFQIGWFLFEFAALTIPICPVHPEGECDPEMMAKLNEYAPNAEKESIDPRWEQLKSLINN